MGDMNPIRTLGGYSKPSYEGYRNTIELPVRNNLVPLRSDTIRNDEGIEWLDVEEPLDLVNTKWYEYMGRNFIGLGRDMHVFVGNMSYVMDFTILESIETNIDPSLSNVVFGRPFVEIPCLAKNRKYGLMTFTDGIKEITFKTPYKDLERSELSSEGHDLLSSRIILGEDNYDRGCRKPSDLEDGFYRDPTKFGPEYLTRMDDEGEVNFGTIRIHGSIHLMKNWGRSRKAHLLEDKQIPIVGVFDDVFLALGWHLEEIHVKDIHDKIVRFEELELLMEREWQQVKQMQHILFADQLSILFNKKDGTSRNGSMELKVKDES
ncbi:hypothetical protein Tco_1554145 [Tanacetum coccineum]